MKNSKFNLSTSPEPGIEDGVFCGNEPISLCLWDERVDGFIAGLDISPQQLQTLRRLAKESGSSLADLLQSGLDHVLAGGSSTANNQQSPKIPKGFVLVNLSESEKRELRDLARESGQEFRGALRHALFDIRRRLKSWVRVQRVTGLNPMQQDCFFHPGSNSN